MPTKGDPKKRNDAFYVHNKDFEWSFDQKQFIPRKEAKKKKPFTFDQLTSTFGGHGTVNPQKTKLEKLGDDKGLDSRKKALEKRRYFEQLRGSSDQKKHVRVVKYVAQRPVNITKKVPVVRTTRNVIPKILPKPVKSDQHISALQEYLREQHGMIVSKSSINEQTLPFLAFDEKGRPALYGDPILHQKMGLPDAYRVVTGPTGVVHKSYDPSKVKPNFFKTHESSVVQQY